MMWTRWTRRCCAPAVSTTKLFMGKAAESQKAELYRRFFPDATDLEAGEFAREHRAETMAEFQGLLLALEQECSLLDMVLVRK
jgi:hypothetical protein